MDIEWVRKYCLSFPHTTESVQWGDHLVLKIGGKMYAVLSLDPAGNWLSLKCTPEDFADLTERPGVIPVPYLARAQWVALETEDALPRSEVKQLLSRAYETVFANLPKKTQATLVSGPEKSLKQSTPSKKLTPRRKSTSGTRRKLS